MINWVIVDNNDRGSIYGVGTFINELIKGVSKEKLIDIYLLKVGYRVKKEYSVEKVDGITIINIPIPSNWIELDHECISRQKKIAKRIVSLTTDLFEKKKELVIHLNYIYQFFLGEAFKAEYNCKLIYTHHAEMKLEKSISSNNLFSLSDELFCLVDRVIAVTNHGKRNLINDMKATEDKIEVIYNGIDLPLKVQKNNLTKLKRKLNLIKYDKIIMYAGRLDKEKGIYELLDAFELINKNHPNSCLIMAGTGKLLDQQAEYNANIIFTGFVDRKFLCELYRIADVGVLPSYEEQCSFVLLEMLQSGLPVVANSVGGLIEIINHGTNGFLTEYIINEENKKIPSVDSLVTGIIEITGNEHTASRYSKGAEASVQKFFTRAQMCSKYIDLINSIRSGQS